MLLNRSGHLHALLGTNKRDVMPACNLPIQRKSLRNDIRNQQISHSRIASICLVCNAAAATNETEKPALKTIVQGRNIKLTEALRNFAEEKVSKVLSRYAVSIREVDVSLSVSKGKGEEKHKCEVTVFLYRLGVVRAEEVEENMYAAIENVSDIVARKMRKVKDKAIMKGKWEGRAGPRGHKTSADLPEEVSSDDEDIDLSGTAPPLAPEVVRTKVMSLDPMSVNDAMEEAENVGHTAFYVFKDLDGTVKVLYKRQHRGYGVIVPK